MINIMLTTRNSTNLVKTLQKFIDEKTKKHVIVTYTISDADLRNNLEKILLKYKLEKENDQSTYKGAIGGAKLEEFMNDIRHHIVGADDFNRGSDFVSVYYSEEIINQRVLK